MKKTFFSLAFCALALGAYAQTSGWETGVNLSGGASDYLFTNVQPVWKPVMDDIHEATTPQFCYSVGVYGRKFFKEMYGVEVALQYTSFALGNKKMEYTDINGLQGKAWSNIRHNYVELPVRFVFKKDLGSVFSIGCFAGIAPAILTHAIQRDIQKPYEGEQVVQKQSRTAESNRFNLFADAGLLLRANISTHFALDLKPFFRMSALPIHKKNAGDLPSPDTHHFAGGATVSTVWKF